MKFTPRRSVLYMPGANQRAMEKARGLDCDTIIFDLEDAVAQSTKAAARDTVRSMIDAGGYGHRELVVRVNGADTPWGDQDVAAMASLPIAGMLFPKVESAQQVTSILAALDQAGGDRLPIWLMIETPRGVLDVRQIASCSPRIAALVMGTSDLVKELRAEHTPARHNIAYALQHSVLAAREAGVDILDGVHLDFRNQESFQLACEQGRAMGFDGKTLIHPSQIEAANAAFGYPSDAVQDARAVMAVWQQAEAEGKGVAVLDGRLIENLHAAEAERVLAFAEALAGRQD